jgi:hypothetical protein
MSQNWRAGDRRPISASETVGREKQARAGQALLGQPGGAA